MWEVVQSAVDDGKAEHPDKMFAVLEKKKNLEGGSSLVQVEVRGGKVFVSISRAVIHALFIFYLRVRI